MEILMVFLFSECFLVSPVGFEIASRGQRFSQVALQPLHRD